jgi:nucleotide-binding universal stress UspA family protein
MKILLAIDGSSCSDVAVNEVARRPWPPDSQVRVISVVEPPLDIAVEGWVPPDDYMQRLEKAARERAEATVKKAIERVQASAGDSIQVTSEIISGHAKNAILHEAESWGADLIVLGSHGYRGLKRLWLGSVSHAVASHANCSVEIVRCPQAHKSRS